MPSPRMRASAWTHRTPSDDVRTRLPHWHMRSAALHMVSECRRADSELGRISHWVVRSRCPRLQPVPAVQQMNEFPNRMTSPGMRVRWGNDVPASRGRQSRAERLRMPSGVERIASGGVRAGSGASGSAASDHHLASSRRHWRLTFLSSRPPHPHAGWRSREAEDLHGAVL